MKLIHWSRIFLHNFYFYSDLQEVLLLSRNRMYDYRAGKSKVLVSMNNQLNYVYFSVTLLQGVRRCNILFPSKPGLPIRYSHSGFPKKFCIHFSSIQLVMPSLPPWLTLTVSHWKCSYKIKFKFINPLNTELNPICQ